MLQPHFLQNHIQVTALPLSVRYNFTLHAMTSV